MDFAYSNGAAEDRTRWKGIVVKSSVVPQQPNMVLGQTRLDLYIICYHFLSRTP